MGEVYTKAEAETIRAFVRDRVRARRRELANRLAAARKDFDAVVTMAAHDFQPVRMYQWGSLVNDRHFSEMSDIDLAVEGITDPRLLSELRRRAAEVSSFQLDIVAIEHVHSAYAEHIRQHGRVVYERPRR
jgi:hypothetical protein